MNPSAEIIENISVVLGRTVSSNEAGSIAAFSDFSEGDFNDFRLLVDTNSVLAVYYIKYKLKGQYDLATIVSFYSAVVQRGVSFDDWERER